MQSEQFLRQRKMLLVLPALIIPMLALAFYGLGGGKGGIDGSAMTNIQKGLNTTLPPAHFDAKAKPMDKLAFYEKAALDSARLKERMKEDPYSSVNPSNNKVKGDTSWLSRITGDLAKKKPGINNYSSSLDGDGPNASGNAQADLVMRKLSELKETLGKSKSSFEGTGYSDADKSRYGSQSEDANLLARLSGRSGHSSDTSNPEARIQNVLAGLKGNATASADPEMDKLDGMLDKLLRIQHPDQGPKDSTAPLSVPGASKVEAVRPDNRVGSLENSEPLNNNESQNVGFMEIGETETADTGRELAIQAVINTDQTLTSGSTVSLRLVDEAVVSGHLLPRNQLLYGLANINGERVTVNITSARVGQTILPVALQVYDLDGLLGIRAQGAITRDVSKESADQAMGGLELASLDPSLGAQAASAGLQFAKSLASKKIKLVRVSLPSGYTVLLKNSKTNIR